MYLDVVSLFSEQEEEGMKWKRCRLGLEAPEEEIVVVDVVVGVGGNAFEW